MRFGDILRKLLEEKAITQKQFAKDVNISPSTIGNYIRNIREPDFETLCLIADYFSVSSDYLLNRHISPLDLTPIENDMLRIFRQLSSEQQAIYLEQGKAFIKQSLSSPKNE